MASAEEIIEAFAVTGLKTLGESLLSKFAGPGTVKDIQGSGNRTLLHEAARRGWLDTMKLLIDKYGCDPFCETSNGTTLLHVACLKNHFDVVEYLTREFCMDPLKTTEKEHTPLGKSSGRTNEYLQGLIDTAKKQGFESVVQYLKHCREQKYNPAFAELMKNGRGEFILSNMILHGPPGAGKSSVKRLILGQPPLSKHNQSATNVLEGAVRAVCVDRVAVTGGYLDVITENSQIIERLAGEVQRLHDKVAAQTSTEPETEEVVDPKIATDGPVEKCVAEADVKTRESIKKQISEAKSSTRMFGLHWHHYIDSGGQPQFLDVVPLLYCGHCTHFILVMRLTEGLHKKPKVRFYNQGKNIYELPDRLVLTNHDMVIRMCQIAQSIAKATKGKFVPKVFVVGTHKDGLLPFIGEEQVRKMNVELLKVHKDYSDVLIRRSSSEVIISLNAMAEGEQRVHYTREIQRLIQMETEMETEGCRIEVPVKWFTLHLELDRSSKGVLSLHKCYDIGKKHGLVDKEVRSALEFLNKAALILYYPNDVPDLVLTKMDPFINRLSCLIKASFISPDNGPERESIELRQKGVFEKRFLKRAFQGIEEKLISDEQFLKLLESLKVAVHIEGEKYFLPSALSLEAPSHNESSFTSGPIPLALSWGDMILPHGFFLTVVVELLQKSIGEDGHKFVLRRDKAQWRGEVQVSEAKGKIPGMVKLSDKAKWIQVSYSSDGQYCSIVHSLVDEAVQRAIKRFQHTGIGSPIIGYLCPLCKKKNHYCYLSDDRLFVTCSQNPNNTGRVTDDMLLWIKGSCSRCVRTPELKDVYRLLKPKSYHWHVVGGHLGVEFGFRESLLRAGVMRTDDSKLEAVLNNWIVTHCSEVSWDNLIQVLTELEFIDLVREIKEKKIP